VFIDPAYQDGSDLERTVRLAKHLRTAWRSARLAVWYPVRRELSGKVDTLHKSLKREVTDTDILAASMILPAEPGLEGRLEGNGMVMVSPPYGMDDDIRECLDELGMLLTEGRGGHEVAVEWIRRT